jgi:hypothetical protein
MTNKKGKSKSRFPAGMTKCRFLRNDKQKEQATATENADSLRE